MATENANPVKISEENMVAANGLISQFETLLNPALISLSAEQRRALPRIGKNTRGFVNKVSFYAKLDPKFSPFFMDGTQMEDNIEIAEQLSMLYKRLVKLVGQLDDTIILRSSNAYSTALDYYHMVKRGVNSNVLGAKSIHNDLKMHFTKSSGTSDNENPEANT